MFKKQNDPSCIKRVKNGEIWKDFVKTTVNPRVQENAENFQTNQTLLLNATLCCAIIKYN